MKNLESKVTKALKQLRYENKSMIRLLYIYLQPYHQYGTNELKCSYSYASSSVFELPDGMTMEQACKVVSYLSELVEREQNLEPASYESVGAVSHILKDYGFVKDEYIGKNLIHITANEWFVKNPKLKVGKLNGVVDLITFNGNSACFKRSDLYDRYFNWFTENVSKNEVDEIYQNLNILNQQTSGKTID